MFQAMESTVFLHNKKIANPITLKWLWISIAVVIIDQWSKFFVVHALSLFQPKVLLPFLNFTFVINHGAAFSFLNSQGGWQRWLFVVIAITISICVLMWMNKTPRKKVLLNVALALILGGALANLWDRVTLGYVIDFIDFHIGHWHFATFNIADSAVCIGVVLLLIDLTFLKSFVE